MTTTSAACSRNDVADGRGFVLGGNNNGELRAESLAFLDCHGVGYFLFAGTNWAMPCSSNFLISFPCFRDVACTTSLDVRSGSSSTTG